MTIIIMGVSGAGKTTVGRMLAVRLCCEFYDADHFHSKENIDKMNSGIPLTDSDRLPWLYSIQDLIKQQNGNAIIACSALKKSYRVMLDVPDKNVVCVYLKGDKKILLKRLLDRAGHYAGAHLLDSQLRALEEPEEALTFDIVTSPEDIVEGILKQIDL